MMNDILRIQYNPSISDQVFKESYEYNSSSSTFSFNPLCTDEIGSTCYPYKVLFHSGLYHFDLYGAQGSGSGGGNGGYASGDISFLHPITLYLFIGTRNGFNGGGLSTNLDLNGGGASDVRILDIGTNEEDQNKSLRSRIIVAGGGGGYLNWNPDPANGGCGGGIIGDNGIIGEKPSGNPYIKVNPSTGGNQTNGGIIDTTNRPDIEGGSFGFGGPAASNYPGGGGGGWYGGAGGGDGSYCASSGAGGSSFISGHKECQAIDSEGNPKLNSFHFSGLYFTNTKTEKCKREGNGFISIKLIHKYIIISVPCHSIRFLQMKNVCIIFILS